VGQGTIPIGAVYKYWIKLFVFKKRGYAQPKAGMMIPMIMKAIDEK
jgi:hypothetical protein